jgi:hypothetical protein
MARMNTSAKSKFLVLLDGVPRACLFDSERRLVGEVIDDDGFIVETLLRTATPCPPESDALLRAISPPPPPGEPSRCFELG